MRGKFLRVTMCNLIACAFQNLKISHARSFGGDNFKKSDFSSSRCGGVSNDPISGSNEAENQIWNTHLVLQHKCDIGGRYKLVLG